MDAAAVAVAVATTATSPLPPIATDPEFSNDKYFPKPTGVTEQHYLSHSQAQGILENNDNGQRYTLHFHCNWLNSHPLFLVIEKEKKNEQTSKL